MRHDGVGQVGAQTAQHDMLADLHARRGLTGALCWLDARLAAALALTGPESGGPDPFRGLYVTQRQAEELLARERGSHAAPADQAELEVGGSLAILAERFGLADPDLKLFMVALAPELDLRYERIYGYLQDDVTRCRATVDLALRLVFEDSGHGSPGHAHLWPTSPLIRHGLLEVVGDPSQYGLSGLAAGLRVDEQVVRTLLGYTALDPRLAATCRLLEPGAEAGVSTDATAERIRALCQEPAGVRIYLREDRTEAAAEVPMAAASLLGVPLLEVDVEKLPNDVAGRSALLGLVLRECRWRGAVLHLRGVDGQGWHDQRDLGRPGPGTGLVCVISGPGPLGTLGELAKGTIPIQVPGLGYRDRRACWAGLLSTAGIEVAAADLDALAARFRISPAKIAAAITAASASGTGQASPPGAAELFAAARIQSGHELESQAQRLEPRYRWSDIVLTDEQSDQFTEICDRVRLRHVVYEEWGFERKVSLGRGLSVLFSGGPGTGKTMAAEVIAGELDLDLFRIDLAQVVSKYIGDTEKRLESIFRHAEATDAVLFFDEAEALFGKRSEVRDAHDRYANIEVAYLLQRMEVYDGITILATNLRKNIDAAFMRRLQFAVEFPHPDQRMRLEIWRRVWPDPGRLGPDADLAFMSSQFDIPGGLIRNIALKAAFLAAKDGTLITLRHLLLAAKRELQNLGKVVVDDDLGIHADLVRSGG